jgi:hypothetical protein
VLTASSVVRAEERLPADPESAQRTRQVVNDPGAATDPVIFVGADADGQQDGSSWDDAYTSLQDALAAAVAGQEIWVASGTYRPDQGAARVPGDRSASFEMVDNVSVYGGFAGTETLRLSCFGGMNEGSACATDLDCAGGQCQDIRDPKLNLTTLTADLDGNDDPSEFPNGPTYQDNSFHVVEATGTDRGTELDGFVITGGNANDTEFADNRGGGIRILFGSPIIKACTLVRNHANQSGGGIFSGVGGPAFIDTIFEQNATTAANGRGGAVSGSLTNLQLVNCGFFGNASSETGGAVYGNLLTDPQLVNCVFSGNHAVDGGGLYTELAANPVVVNCSFGSNTASGMGGGIYLDGSAQISNAILWNNSDAQGSDSSAQVFVASGEVSLDYTVIQGGWDEPGDNILTDDPLFVDPEGPDGVTGTADDNLRPGTDSPVIDAGDTTALPQDEFDLDNDQDVTELIPVDLGGNTRVLDDPTVEDTGVPVDNAVVDIGAYEQLQDCNLNGIPDYLDIAQGHSSDLDFNGIPDECGFWTGGCKANNDWSCFDNWDLPGEVFPDNGEAATYDVIIGTGAVVNLDVDVEINTLLFEGVSLDITELQRSLQIVQEAGLINNGLITLDNDAQLSVCCGGVDNLDTLLILGGGIDEDDELLIGGPGGLRNSGLVAAENNASLTVAGGGIRNLGEMALTAAKLDVIDNGNVETNGPVRVAATNTVNMLSGEMKIGPNGIYQKNAESLVEATAALATATVLITNVDPDELCPPLCGQPTMELKDSMFVSTIGDFVLDGSATTVTAGIAPPPKLVTESNAVVEIGGDLILIGETEVDVMAASTAAAGKFAPTVLLGGNLINQSQSPGLFNWDGLLVMGPSASQSFEVGGEDFGTTLDGFMHPDGHTNFSMAALELAAGAEVTFVNQFANVATTDPLSEALYVEELTLQQGATIIVDAARVYTVTLTDAGADVVLLNGGQLIQIPPIPVTAQADNAININGDVQVCATDDECPGQTTCLAGFCYVPRHRFIAVRTNPGNEGAITARRISVDVDSEEMAPLGWVGEPMLVSLPGPGANSILLSRVVDEPYYTDWSALPHDRVEVGDCQIAPEQLYSVDLLAFGLDPAEEQNYSPPLLLPTVATFGDCCGPGSIQDPPDGSANFVDIQAVVRGFQLTQGAPRTWLNVLAYGEPNPALINFADVQIFVLAFQGESYPGFPPMDCP